MLSWHSMETKEVFKNLKTGEAGLSLDEIEKKREEFGANKLPEGKKFSSFSILFRQFKSPMIYLLVIAGVVSILLHEPVDGSIIFVAVAITVAFGYFQEHKAERTLEKLEEMVEHKARVIRGGEEDEVDAADLVPGDLIILASGDKVPADVRLIFCKNLEVREAALTGESMPVGKDMETLSAGTTLPERVNMAFMGTIVSRGRGRGVVVGTGIKTEFGKIAESVLGRKDEKTPFQIKVARLARWISIVILGVVGIVFAGGILRGIEFAELLTVSVAVAVAAIPESLVIAVTVILAIGMLRLLKRRALMRRLISAETLGSTTVICTDKTGTLTEGEMKVTEVYTEDREEDKNLALEIAMIANEAFVENPTEDSTKWNIHGDPTETALVKAAIDDGLDKRLIEAEEQILDEMPFESQNQYMCTLLRSDRGRSSEGHALSHLAKNIIYYKGSPEKILGASIFIHDSNNTGETTKLYANHYRKLEEAYENFSKKGLRVLAVAYREVPETIKIGDQEEKLEKLSQIEHVLSELTFVGFVAMRDPVRVGVSETINEAKDAGIKVVMITGDHKYTALSVAKELGLLGERPTEHMIEGKDLAKMDDETLQKEVKNIYVYARILPQDKLRIVEAFQKNGEIVAMTGDGVNDAPALKKADIGVAMGAGTDVAKEISDMIILDNNFKSIVRAVEQGRVIFDNLKKVVTYLLVDSFTEVMLIAGSIIAGFPLPVLAGQILWINLVEDGLPSFALAYEPKERDVMKLPPVGRKTPILDREMRVIIFIVGSISNLILLGLFFILFDRTNDIEYVRTMVFAVMGANSLLYIFSIKSLRHPIFRINPFNNLYLIGAVLFGFAMLFVALYVPFFQNILQTRPLSMSDWGIITALAALEIFCIEVVKKVFVAKP